MNRRDFLNVATVGTMGVTVPISGLSIPESEIPFYDGGPEILPKNCNATREQMEAAGFKFVSDYPADNRFVVVHMPTGWRVSYLGDRTKPSRYIFGLGLFDAKNRLRGASYYTDMEIPDGGIPYSAKMKLETRFSIGNTVIERPIFSDHLTRVHSYRCSDNALDGKVIFVSNTVPVPYSRGRDKHKESLQESHDECEQFLNGRYPDWRNPLAYWD